jgi:peptidylprolyl isomerase
MQLWQPLIGAERKRVYQNAGAAFTRLKVPNGSVEQVRVLWSHGDNMSYMIRRVCLPVILACVIAGCAAEPEDAMPPAPIPAPPDVAAVPSDAQTSPSGLAWKVLKPGTGTTKPTATSQVLAHYTGWTTDGQMFDSSVVRGEPLDYPLGGLIAGWIEGMQMMVKGEKRRFWIPQELAYMGQPGAPAGMLVFDIELLDFR